MDTLDRAILNCLQFNFPLTTRPFLSIAKTVGTSEQDVLARIGKLKDQNVVRQISAIFDSSKIGYHSVLAAFKVSAQKLDTVALMLNESPAVSHNYVRTNDYNLWFTVSIPDTRDLKAEVKQMAHRAKVKDWLYLPTIKKFKISFQLDMSLKKKTSGTTNSPQKTHHQPAADKQFPINKQFIRELQKDLPLTSHPYQTAAKALTLTEGKIITELKRYIKAGAIRRIASVLKPVHAGFGANVLVVWDPPADKIDLLGKTAAAQKQVSHCYERPKFPDWPYSLYSMIHGKTKAQCRTIIRTIAKKTGVTKYQELTTVKEYKKIRVEYYPTTI